MRLAEVRLSMVIGRHEAGSHVQITLLEIPENRRDAFMTATLAPLEQPFAIEGAKRFEAALQQPANPEHQSRLGLGRLTFPPGIDDEDHFFEAWSYEGRA